MGHYTASMKRVKGIAERMEGRMGWRNEKPLKNGIYWWRLDDEPLICEIYSSRNGQLVHFMGCKPITLQQIDEAAEWQGPITPEP